MWNLFFLLLLLIIAIVLRIDFFFTIFYLYAAVYVLSHLWMQGVKGRLHVQRHFVDHAFCGDRVVVDVRVRNLGWLPLPWLHVHESLPVQLAAPPFYRQVFSLGSHGVRYLNYTLTCRQRGYYPIGPLNVRSGDLLGVVRPQLQRAEPEYLTVYPRVVPLQQLGLPTRSPQVVLPARSPLFEDPARVMGVRDYQRGDSPRRIHWTATAKVSGQGLRLMVKQYQPAIARETLICLDLHREGYGQRQRYTATELAIVVAASLANHIVVREGLPVGLITEAWDPLPDELVRFSLPPRPGRGHLMSLLEVLARVQVSPTDTSPSDAPLPDARSADAQTLWAASAPFVELLRQGGANLPWGATLSIITGRESAELFDALVYLRRAGFAVVLILVQPALASDELRSDEFRQRAERLNVPVHRVWQERDLEMWW